MNAPKNDRFPHAVTPEEKKPLADESTLAYFRGIEVELEARRRQQTAISELGQAALRSTDFPLLMGQAAALVAEVLGAELCRILEWNAEDSMLRTIGRVGWEGDPDSAQLDSQALFTLWSDEPVVFEQLSEETRFDGEPLLTRNGVVSGAAIAMAAADRPIGVVGAYSRTQRRFVDYELDFLRAIAAVIAAMIENRRRDELLEDSGRRIQRAEKVARMGSWSWNRGNVRWNWSEELFELLDMEASSTVPSYENFLARVHPEDRQAVAATIDRVVRKPGWNRLDHRLLLPGGAERFVQTEIEAIFDDHQRPLRIVGTTRDVTETATIAREQAQLTALIESAAQEWRLTCDAIDSLIIVLQADGTVLRVNRSTRESLGVGYDQLVGRRLPAAGEPWGTLSQLRTVVAETRISTTCQARDESADRSWELSGRHFLGRNEDDERIILIARDVSETVRTEGYRRHNETIEAVSRLTHEVERRLRQPLSTILEDFTKVSEPFGDGLRLRQSLDALREIDLFLRDLHDFAEPFSLELVAASPAPLIDQVSAAMRPVASRRNVSIVHPPMAGLPTLLLHPVRFERLLTDLLQTAIELTRSGGSIALTTEIVAHREGSWVRLLITSSRGRFAEPDLAWMSDSSLPHFGSARALRLSVAQRLAAAHGGILAAWNQEPDEAFISLELPPYRQS
jgi:signal transduction histidine kinase